MADKVSPGRAGLPLSLAPLTPEEAIRKAMSFPVRPKESTAPPAPPKKPPAKATKGNKKG